jgi:hypothetical protein
VAVVVSGLSSYVPLSWRCVTRVGGSFSWFDKEISTCYQGFLITSFSLVNRACSWLFCIIRKVLSKKSWLVFFPEFAVFLGKIFVSSCACLYSSRSCLYFQYMVIEC